MLHRKLSTIRVGVTKEGEDEEAANSAASRQFLKEKLFEAESYIVELQKENESLVQESVDREKAVKVLEDNVNMLSIQIVEAEALNKQYQSKLGEVEVASEEKMK